MTTIEPDAVLDAELHVAGAEARLHRRLRLAGVVAILAAALGSVWSAPSLTTGPVGDRDCVMEVAEAAGFSEGCTERASADR